MKFGMKRLLDLAVFDTDTASSEAGGGAFDASGLPEWDFSSLYTGMDDAKIEQDLASSAADIAVFEQSFKGQLDGLLTSSQSSAEQRADILAGAVKQYEDMSDLLGGIISYAYLLYAQLATDPARIKFLGDVQEKLTELSTKTLFFELELNRIDSTKVDALLDFDSVRHYAPWLKDIRREKPYQLSDELEQLFAEKSVTGGQAWNRLFDETMAGLRFEVDGQEMSVEKVLNLVTSADGVMREKAAKALSKTLEENGRFFTHVTNVLAKDKSISDKWRGFDDVAASRHLANRVEPEVVNARSQWG